MELVRAIGHELNGECGRGDLRCHVWEGREMEEAVSKHIQWHLTLTWQLQQLLPSSSSSSSFLLSHFSLFPILLHSHSLPPFHALHHGNLQAQKSCSSWIRDHHCPHSSSSSSSSPPPSQLFSTRTGGLAVNSPSNKPRNRFADPQNPEADLKSNWVCAGRGKPNPKRRDHEKENANKRGQDGGQDKQTNQLQKEK